MGMTYLLHSNDTESVIDNVVWESEDGTWNRAVFSAYIIEGDELVPCPGGVHPGARVFHDYEHFQWCSRGHRDIKSAVDSWHGRPLGRSSIIDTPEKGTAHLDEIAHRLE